ncbi:MAG TPA: hypothetical protein VKH83_04780 [Methylomirabilota bacterium]|nr:hypothetical protein [Methylomirabilota bacterium]
MSHAPDPPLTSSSVEQDLDLARLSDEEAPHPLHQGRLVGAHHDEQRVPGGRAP